MAKKTPGKAGRARRGAAAHGQVIAAAEFKATCLELMDRVRETGAEYTVTKHGRPVAKLVPYQAVERPSTIFGTMKGSVLEYIRPLDPLDDEWDVNRP